MPQPTSRTWYSEVEAARRDQTVAATAQAVLEVERAEARAVAEAFT
jgi:hypothetical protein